MDATPPVFARDRATATYYDHRAPEYDEWFEDTGKYTAYARKGWNEDVRALVSVVEGLGAARSLDVACGTGYLTQHLAGAVVGLDQSMRMVSIARDRLAAGQAMIGDALHLPFAAGSFDRVLTSHFYGHLSPDERSAFVAEAGRVAPALIVIDSAWRPGIEAEQWQDRVLNDGSRHRIFKRYLHPDQLADEIGGRVLWSGTWFVVAGRG
jgi:demethylmenaquinone methyltransferase/2-methoxy-6-polyprenyl-1,4-benzoquinol methylase